MTPEPSDQERRALAAALEQPEPPPAGYSSAWRREAVEGDEDEPFGGAPFGRY